MYRLLFLLLISHCLSATVTIESNAASTHIIDGIGYLEDPSGTMTYDEAKAATFSRLSSGSANFGFTTSAYWLKIKVRFDGAAKKDIWWLSVDYPLLDYIDLFVVDDTSQQIAHRRGGDLRKKEELDTSYGYFEFRLPFEKDAVYTLLMRVETQGSMQIPISILANDAFLSSRQLALMFTGLYYGIFIIIFFYNLMLYIYTREHNYLVYLFFISSMTLWQLALDGLGVKYIWPEWRWMLEHGVPVSTSLIMLAALLFSKVFLQTRQYTPTLDRSITFFIVLALLTIIAATFVPYHIIIRIIALFTLIVPILLLSTGILVVRKEYYPARFYVAGWSAFLLGTFLFALNKYDVLQGHFVMKYAQQIGSTLEMVFLSWALSSRFKLLQDTYVEQISSINLTLKRRVDQALEQARQKDRLMIQQSRHAAMGEMIGNIAHQWRQPLNALGLLLQNIEFAYHEGDLDGAYLRRTIDKGKRLTQQMSKTIDDFRDFFKPNKAPEVFYVHSVFSTVMDIVGSSLQYHQIEIIDEVDQRVCVQGYLGEFSQVLINVINNAKDVLSEKTTGKRTMTLRVYDRDGQANIEIEDDGGGIPEAIIDKVFDPYFTTKEQGKGTGIGLYMSRVIIANNMKGMLTVENKEDGACFRIIVDSAPCPDDAAH